MKTANFTYSTTGDLEKMTFFSGYALEKRSTGQKIGFNQDHLGNTRLTYEVSWDMGLGTNIQGVYDYFPYGKLLRKFIGGSGHERYLTTQHERDAETISENSDGTGFDNRINRMYDSDIARFTSVDKLADHPNQVSMSPYQYVWGNPIMLTDPDGNCPECFGDWLIGLQVSFNNWWNGDQNSGGTNGDTHSEPLKQGYDLVTEDTPYDGNSSLLKSEAENGAENVEIDYEFESIVKPITELIESFQTTNVDELQQGDSANMKGKTNSGFPITQPVEIDTNSEFGFKNIKATEEQMQDKPTVTP